MAKLETAGCDASYENGALSVTLPPGGMAFYALGDAPAEGLSLGDLALLYLEDGAEWRGETAVLYGIYNGVPEILEYVENGEAVTIGTGEYALKAFSWTAPITPKESAKTYTTP